MTEKPLSPFTGLDKALLRSTQTSQPSQQPATPPNAAADSPEQPPEQIAAAIITPSETSLSMPARKRAPRIASAHASYRASTLAPYPVELVERVRKRVKAPGKEVSFVRLTPDEKAQLMELVYAFKRAGKRTSENEINRIAVNLLLEDHKLNGATSFLARVVDALLA